MKWKFGRFFEPGKQKGNKGKKTFAFEENIYYSVLEQARLEQKQPDRLAEELVNAGLTGRKKETEINARWNLLSAREQEVAALACLGYTYRQIAGKLNITPSTVSWYIQKILIRVGAHSKSELRTLFKRRDFSQWGPPAGP